MRRFGIMCAVGAVLLASLTVPFTGTAAQAQTQDSWPTSLHDNSRDGASADTVIPASEAPALSKLWSYSTGGPIASQPAIVNGVAYVGSWDGYEYALNATTGAVIWKTLTGITTGNSGCNPPTAGISSAATVLNGVVYVGGGDAYWYALDASTGSVLWRVYTGDNSASSGHYNWSSPLVVNGYAYIGVSSLGDCPLVQGQLLQVSLSTHQIVNTLNLVPNGSQGGGIWTSPAYDPALNEIFTVTGTEANDSQTYAQAVIGINASTLAVTDTYHLPENVAVADSDWTTSTGLYPGSNGTPMLVTTNKNGITYAFNRTNLAAGPVWQHQTAIGNDCAVCGYSTVSSAAIAQGVVYQAGGATSINGTGYGGSVQALNATTGAVIWQHPDAGPVIGAIAYMNGMVIDYAGSGFEVLDAATGHRLYSYDAASWSYAAPAIANGMIVTGSTAGVIYAFGLPSTLPSPPPPDANCPSGDTCQDIGSTGGSESVSGGTWTVTAGGSGITGASDQFRLMSQPSAGDVQITARVTARAAASQAGIMLRQSNDPGSPYYGIFVTSAGLSVQYRKTLGGATTVANTTTLGSLPVYLEIQRQGDLLTAATSADGVTYTAVPGSQATVLMPYASLAGLAASSGTATFDSFAVGAISGAPQNAPPATACPSGWSCGDVGYPLVVGNQSLSGATWTFSGAGNGIGPAGMTDQFHYVWTSTTGDTTVSTRITALNAANAGAKAGVMMRGSTSGNAPYYGAFVTPFSGIVVMERDTSGLPSETLATISGTAPAYLRIARSGNTFSAYTSSDGATWTPVVGSSDTIPNLSGSMLDGEAVTSATAPAAATVTANVLSVTGSAPPPPTACPANWTCADIGGPIPPGSNYLVNGEWSILGGGKDLWGAKDEFHYTAQTVPGDATISAQITSQQNTDPWAKSGIMLRASTDPGAPYYAILSTGANGTVVQYRTASGGSTSQLTGVSSAAPIWVKVIRTGTSFTAYTSTDGTNWTAYPSSTVTIPALSGSILGGMADTSHSQFTTSTTVFDHFTDLQAGSSLPVPWSDSDIGSPTPAGSASYAGGVFTLNGGGNDIWGTLDQFNYVSQSLTGDGSIVARVTAQSNTSAWAKSGIMIKQSTTAGSAYALLAVTPGNGVAFQHGYNAGVSGGSYTFPNAWLKLTRTGSVITAYTSADGTTWTQVGTTTITMTDPVTVGLFVTSHNAGSLNTSTFDNVSVTSGGSNLPVPWSDSEVGGPTPAGSASYAGGVFTVNGGGNDIWGTQDQFNYVSQSLTGDGSIVARVTSQANTDPWAKSGIMIKQSTTAGSAYALLAVTPGNGVTFQHGYNASVGGGSYTFPNAWLKLTRAGSVITAYTSADGTTWTQVGTTTIAMTDPVTIGVFVCSHNAGALNTSTFDNVSITVP
jgi:outer membrane protein assembly factor BamB/regulation of enolase protein 1 (concanavalin A-like superfamily)